MTNEEKNIEILINELGVFELRGVARQLGVHSPTTKKREELINLIQEAIKSGATLKDNFPKRGRPFKKLNILDGISEKINNEVLKIDFSNTRKVVNFAQDGSFNYDYEEVVGIIQKYNYNIEMRDIATGTLVKFEKADELEDILQLGDKVKASVIKGDDIYLATRVLSVNGQDFSTYKSKFFEKGNAIISAEKVPFATGEAVVGRRNLFKLDRELFETRYLQDLYLECQKEGFEFILLAANTSFENEIVFGKLPTTNKFIAAYGTDNLINYHKILDALNYAENLVNRGKKVILFVADIIEIVRSLDRYFDGASNNVEKHDEATLFIVQKLLRFARAYENGCDGTVIMCYNDVDSDNNFLVKDVLKISNRIN